MTELSVVICAYNEASHIAGALGSVAAQTLSPDRYELVVVDDGSTDGTVDVVRQETADVTFDVTVLENHENRGLVPTANRGVRAANGQYVVRLDGDDAFAPRALARLLKRRLETGAPLVCSDRYEVEAVDSSVSYVRVSPEDIYSLVAAGTLLDRQRVIEVGGYQNVFWEEYDLYIRYLRDTGDDPVWVPNPLIVYLRHGDSMTADVDRVREGWAELLDRWGEETLRRYGTLPPDITAYES
jgi:glycosyltransferase involved in cell wall biosynthesis